MAATAPKTHSKRIDNIDARDAFVGEVVAGRTVTYKSSPSYWHRADYKTIVLGEGDKTIKGTFYATLDLTGLQEFLDWLKVNTAWHKTKVTYNKPKQAVLTGSFSLPKPEVTTATVDSTFHRVMTDRLTADLAGAIERKANRVAKQKAETAARAKKRREDEAAAKKKARLREEREQALIDAAKVRNDFGDLAQALKVLKKHGLKIVTIDDEGKVKA